MKKIITFILLVFLSSHLSAATVFWTGTLDSDWSQGANWSSSQVPGADDDVIVSTGTNKPVISTGSLTIKSLSVFNFMEITIANGATLTVAGSTTYGVNIIAGSTVTNNGTLIVSDSADDGVYNKGIFINASTGMVSISNAASLGFYNEGSSPFTNHGSIEVTSSSNDGFYNFGTFSNSSTGTITINSPGDFGIYNSTNKSFENSGTINIFNSVDDGVQNAGTITNKNGASWSITNAMDFGVLVTSTGTFTNEGTLNVNNPTDDGINNTGSFINNAGATININSPSGDPSADGVDNNAGGTFNNLGLTNVEGQPDKIIEGLGIFYNKIGGELRGSGDIEASYFSGEPGSILSPGNSPGSMNFDSGENFTGNTFNIEIGGTNAGTDYDQINVDGTAIINNATLNVSWINGYLPTGGETFSFIITTDGIAGSFTSINIQPVNGMTFTATAQGSNFILQAAVLPVALNLFTVEYDKGNIHLLWETASELNNLGFELEHSNDRLDWDKIGFIAGNGNSNNLIRYTFLDENPTEGVHYYRLKQVDWDGGYEYSKVVAVFVEIDQETVRIHPNPVSTALHISLKTFSNNATCQIFNYTGELLLTKKINDVDMVVETASLKTGAYVLKISNENRIFHKRFIKN